MDRGTPYGRPPAAACPEPPLRVEVPAAANAGDGRVNLDTVGLRATEGAANIVLGGVPDDASTCGACPGALSCPPGSESSPPAPTARRRSELPLLQLPDLRVYQVWPHVGGRNRFLCGGRCITGPWIDFGHNCCAWCFIAVPSCLYFVICAQYLWTQVSPWLPVLTGAALLSTVIFLLLTSCTDPGIIPRHRLQQAVRGLEDEVAIATDVEPPAYDAAICDYVVNITEQQHRAGYRWCPSCKIVRPPRASHCRDCDNCVLTFDHHCPYVNNCVGQRNYAFFSGFLISALCLGVGVFAGVGIYMSHVTLLGDHGLLVNKLMVGMLLVLIGVPTCLLVLGVIGLTCFHAYLAFRGRTTREALTGRVTVAGRTLSTLRGRSLIHRRDVVSGALALPLEV